MSAQQPAPHLCELFASDGMPLLRGNRKGAPAADEAMPVLAAA